MWFVVVVWWLASGCRAVQHLGAKLGASLQTSAKTPPPRARAGLGRVSLPRTASRSGLPQLAAVLVGVKAFPQKD